MVNLNRRWREKMRLEFSTPTYAKACQIMQTVSPLDIRRSDLEEYFDNAEFLGFHNSDLIWDELFPCMMGNTDLNLKSFMVKYEDADGDFKPAFFATSRRMSQVGFGDVLCGVGWYDADRLLSRRDKRSIAISTVEELIIKDRAKFYWECYVSNSNYHTLTTWKFLQRYFSDSLNIEFTPNHHLKDYTTVIVKRKFHKCA